MEAYKHKWKWKCFIPNEPLVFISRIPRLKEWLLYQCQISREQLEWMDEWMDVNGAASFYEIKHYCHDAASYMHLSNRDRLSFFRKLKRAMRLAADPRLHEAPALTPRAALRQEIDQDHIEAFRAVTRGFAPHPMQAAANTDQAARDRRL